MKFCTLAALLLSVLALTGRAAEEHIRGVLEKTVKPGACAQITDALSEIYYVLKTEEAEKLVAECLGKNIKVVVTGVAVKQEGDPAFFFSLKSVEKARTVPPPAKPASAKSEILPIDPPPAEEKTAPNPPAAK